jgi:hypothetical protein
MGNVRIPQLIVVASFVVGLALYSSLSVHHDVAWLMYCGQRMFHGARLYVDCVEVNPPISFYLTLLPAYVAERFDLPANLCLTVYVLALAAFSISLSFRIFKGESRSETWWIGAILAVALIFTPIKNFGQREHFAAILVLPYLLSCNARMSGQPVSRPIAFVAGLMAGLGFSIKHYFLLVPLLMEAVLAVRGRSLRSLTRPEIYGAVLAGLSHAVFAVIAHPEYFTTIAPMAMAAYDGYAMPYWKLVMQLWCLVTAFAVVYYQRIRRIAAPSTAANVLAVAATGFFALYFVQDRGWQYHVLPAQIFILAASLIVVVKTFLAEDRHWTRVPVAQMPLLCLPAAAIVIQVLVSGTYANATPRLTLPYIEKFSPNRTYYFLSSNLSMGFPLPVEEKVTWGSRFPFQWLLPGVVKGLRGDCDGDVERCAKLREIQSYIFKSTAEDLESYAPGIVLVDFRTRDDPDFLYGDVSFDLLEYFLKNSPRFAEAWRHYQLLDRFTVTPRSGRPRTFEVWVRRTGTEAPEPTQTSLGTVAPVAPGVTP